MKKTSVIALALVLVISLLAACGGDDGGSAPADVQSDAPAVTGTENGGDAPASAYGDKVDLSDKNIYFAIIDGVKYSIVDNFTLQDLINAGYSAEPDTDFDRMVNYGIYVGDELFDVYIKMYKDGVEKVYFRAYPNNPNSDPIPLINCSIYGISFSSKDANISIVGGLRIGDPQQAFRDVFSGIEPNNEGEVPGYKDRLITNYMAADSWGVFSFSYSEDPDELKEISVSYLVK